MQKNVKLVKKKKLLIGKENGYWQRKFLISEENVNLVKKIVYWWRKFKIGEENVKLVDKTTRIGGDVIRKDLWS